MSDEREFKLDLPNKASAAKKPTMAAQARMKQGEKKKELKLSNQKIEHKARRDYVEQEEQQLTMKDRLAGGLASKIQLGLFLFVIAVFAYFLVPIAQEILNK